MPRSIGLKQARGQVDVVDTDQAHMHPAGDNAPADGDAYEEERSQIDYFEWKVDRNRDPKVQLGTVTVK